jgi:hypothetical protein
MIISDRYGPQYDATGTSGKNKIVDLDGNPTSVISLVTSDESTHTVGGW